jgi:cobyrinic acid a,c-diamide synthase
VLPIDCPAILIAAPASGQGKATVACALARLHARQGRHVRAFKCGPDFLDPYWLTLASGAPVHQLDLWMTGAADCAQRMQEAAQHADLIIVEGAMGPFDGQPGAADLAQRFGLPVLPVLPVIDAGAIAGTFGALVCGLQSYREGLRFFGVLANRVVSPGHALMLEESLRDPAQWLGALMRNEAFTLPERHLGLVMDQELGDTLQRLHTAADARATTKLGKMTAGDLQAWAVSFEAAAAPAPDFPLDALQGQTIAVARDSSFFFLYAANLDCPQAMGASLVYFSPLADAALPPCDALWLPGGYPELHAQTLATNAAMKASVVAHVQAGKPVWAECGGMMVLFDQLTGVNGASQPMFGVLTGSVTMQRLLAALGPQQLDVAGGTLSGHTFHYSTCATPLQPAIRTQAAPRPHRDAPCAARVRRFTSVARSKPVISTPGLHPARLRQRAYF